MLKHELASKLTLESMIGHDLMVKNRFLNERLADVEDELARYKRATASANQACHFAFAVGVGVGILVALLVIA